MAPRVLAVLSSLPFFAHAASGRLAWSWDSGGTSIEASPAVLVENGTSTLFIATYAGSVTALAGATGKRTGVRFDEGEMIRCKPAVYEFSPALAAFFFIAGDGKFYSVNAETGKLLWVFSSGETPGSYQASSPAVLDLGNGTALVFAGSVDGHLRALDAATGAVVWALATGGPIYSSPQVSVLPASAGGGPAVVVGSDDGAVYTADALTGALRWRFGTGGLVRGSFNFTSPDAAGNVSVLFGSNDYNVYAVDLATGAQRWAYATAGFVTSTPQVLANVSSGAVTLFVGSYDYKVYALDAATGTLQWAYKTLGSVIASPTVVETSAGPRIYVGCDQTLAQTLFYALDAASGTVAWTYFVEDAPIWSTATPVDDALVVFGDQTGMVWALELP